MAERGRGSHLKEAGYCVVFTLLFTVLPHRAVAYMGPDSGGFIVDTIIPFAIAMLLIAPWMWALTDIMKNSFSGSRKKVWLLVVRLVPLFGFLLYFLIGRRQRL